ncbi:MAG: hypothetical protein WDZ53_06995 [Balneolales bacterium]
MSKTRKNPKTFEKKDKHSPKRIVKDSRTGLFFLSSGSEMTKEKVDKDFPIYR